jgi:hypothetical protein
MTNKEKREIGKRRIIRYVVEVARCDCLKCFHLFHVNKLAQDDQVPKNRQ